MRYFIHIGYKGTRYYGWQRQPRVDTVQQVLEESLSRILKKKHALHGCGRTDSGVHAMQYFSHVDIDDPLSFDLKFRWNHVLPNDISVFDIIPMEGKPHARYDATQRSYDYFFHNYKDPFMDDYSTFMDTKNFDLAKMQQAAQLIPAYRDFRAFCKSPDKNEHTVCEVSTSHLFTDTDQNRFRFSISANRFLGRMIRIIIKKLFEIGEGTLSLTEFESHLRTGKIPPSIIPAAPQGLFLTKIVYPYLNIPAKPQFPVSFENVCGYWKSVK